MAFARLAQTLRRQPRLSSALAFGGAATAVTFLSWRRDVRFSGVVPMLIIGAGLAHALAGAITGPRLVDPTRTRSAAQGACVGLLTSLLAALLFVPPFAVWIVSGNASRADVLSDVLLAAWVGLFSFLAIGWTLCLASGAVGWALFRTGTAAADRSPIGSP
jgi:hypothetical protein